MNFWNCAPRKIPYNRPCVERATGIIINNSWKFEDLVLIIAKRQTYRHRDRVHFNLYTSTSVSPSVIGCCFPSAILDFQNFEILTVSPLYGPICIIMPNFAKIGQSLVVISRFLWFFKMATAAVLFFLKIQNFNDLSPVEGNFASSCQISSKSVKRLGMAI